MRVLGSRIDTLQKESADTVNGKEKQTIPIQNAWRTRSKMKPWAQTKAWVLLVCKDSTKTREALINKAFSVFLQSVITNAFVFGLPSCFLPSPLPSQREFNKLRRFRLADERLFFIRRRKLCHFVVGQRKIKKVKGNTAQLRYPQNRKRPTTKGQTHSKICLRGKPQLSRQTGSVS